MSLLYSGMAYRMATNIKGEVYRGFKPNGKHITGNLMDTMRIECIGNEAVSLEIPAQKYDWKEWNARKAIVHTGQGSYAKDVAVFGGKSGKHSRYVSKAIRKGIKATMAEYGVKKFRISGLGKLGL